MYEIPDFEDFLDYGMAENNLFFSTAALTAIKAAIVFFAVYMLVVAAAVIVVKVFGGIGLFNMSFATKTKKPWYAFVPFFDLVLMGAMADKYRGKSGNGGKNGGRVLLVLGIVTYALLFIGSIAISMPVVDMVYYGITDRNITPAMAVNFITVTVPMLLAFLAAIAFGVFYYIALYKLFALFDGKNAVLYLVLSIIFPVTQPFFLYAASKKQPCFSYAERKAREQARFAAMNAQPTPEKPEATPAAEITAAAPEAPQNTDFGAENKDALPETENDTEKDR